MTAPTHDDAPAPRRWTRLRRRLVRAVLALAVSFGAMTVTARASEDETKQALAKLGDSLRQSGSGSGDGARHLVLNGVHIGVTSQTTGEPVAGVLDAAARGCGQLHVIRDGDDAAGFVACVSGAGSGALGLLDVGLNLLSPAEADVGIVTYVQARRDGARTQVIRLDTNQALSIPRLMPGHGDAPGFDLAGIPRPPDADRWMSFREDGFDYQSVIYGHGTLSPARTLAWYRERLAARGWTLYGPDDLGRSEAFLYALKGDALVFLVFGDDCDGTCTVAIGGDTEILRDLAGAAR